MLLLLFVKLGIDIRPDIVMAYPFDRILCLCPDKARPFDKTRLDQCGFDRDIGLGNLIKLFDLMDSVPKFESAVPQDIEDLLYQLPGIVSGDLFVDDHQVDIRIDAELFPAVGAQCHQCDRQTVFHRCIVTEHLSECHLVDEFQNRVYLFGMFDQKIFTSTDCKGILKGAKVAFDILFEDFGDLKVRGIPIQKLFNLIS